MTSKRRRPGDRVFQGAVTALAMAGPAVLLVLVIVLFLDSREALGRYGFDFFTTNTWDPVAERFGVGHYIYGTLVSSAVALLIAAPLAIGASLFLAEYAPAWLRGPVGQMIEMLAVIPSIVYGLWGFFVLAPFMRLNVEPFLRDTIGNVPVIGALFSGPTVGKDILTASVILAIMVLPTVTAVSREIMRAVPGAQREGMIALGATRWETIAGAVLPYARSGIAGAIMLGFARAFGETMAVTMVIGNSSRAISPSLFNPGYTMASAIANQFNEADKEIYFSAIVAVAFTLLLVSVIVNALARVLITRTARGPAGLRI